MSQRWEPKMDEVRSYATMCQSIAAREVSGTVAALLSADKYQLADTMPSVRNELWP